MKITFKNSNFTTSIKTPISIIDLLIKDNKKELLKNALFAIYNNDILDLMTPIEINDNDVEVELIYDPDDKRFFEVMNHSCAHLMAAAILEIWPNSKLWVGPAIKEGFYYDVDIPSEVISQDLAKIEKKMIELLKTGPRFKREIKDKKEMLNLFKHDEYKTDLINNIKSELTIYRTGNFFDLCRGPHVADSKWIKHFKLLSITGAYFKGDSHNKMLTRIYGTCWQSKEKLNNYIELIQLRKDRDHRKIGKEMKLFMFTPLTGQGLAIWLPNGVAIREKLSSYIKKIENKYDFVRVSTPVLGSVELYKTSGHWSHYRQNMYPEIVIDDEHLVLRPMSCPQHCVIFKHELKSYRDLPVRIAEEVLQHRYEASGALSGLERVRAMNLTDAHIFTSFDNLESEIKHLLDMIQEVLNKLDIKINYYRLSLCDHEDKVNFFDDEKMWNKAEKIFKETLNRLKIPFTEAKGEAAFYGPKLDIQVETILGHEITISTLQLDFLLPERFDLNFINKNNEKERPVMLHRGLIGTYERFLSILIEQNNGIFPFWLAPIQLAILPVNDNQIDYCKNIVKNLKMEDFSCLEYYDNNRLSYRLREAQISKIPYQIIIGDEEMANGTIQVREYGSKISKKYNLKDFISILNQQK